MNDAATAAPPIMPGERVKERALGSGAIVGWLTLMGVVVVVGCGLMSMLMLLTLMWGLVWFGLG